MGSFFHAIHVFWDHLSAVKWEFLMLALGLHAVRLFLRSIAWQAILKAAYPEERLPLRTVLGAYTAGVGINSLAPARAGDAVKLYLLKHRMKDGSYTTLTPTLVAETLFDFFVAGGLILWALASGVLPTHELYSRLPSVDWGFFVKHSHETEIGLAALAAAVAVGGLIFLEHGREAREKIGRGFAIMRDPWRLARAVILPQALSWGFRLAVLYYFLIAFGVNATLHNALLALVVESLATLFPATPGGAGTKQGLIVFMFRGEAISSSLLLAFSVGMNIAVVVCNLIFGAIATYSLARTFSWKALRAKHVADGPE